MEGTITEKTSGGEDWDYPGGLPDPFVTIYVGSSSSAVGATTANANTLSPVWNEYVPDLRADELGAYLGFEVWDEDLSSNDVIGTCAFGVDVEFETPELPYTASCGAATITYYVRRH